MKQRIKQSLRQVKKNASKKLSRYPRTKALAKRAYGKLFSRGEQRIYDKWVKVNFPTNAQVKEMQKESDNFTYRPLISICLPTYNTPIGFLKECLDSVVNQAYDNWQLCIVDDASTHQGVRDVIEQYATNDSRITYKFSQKNQHISGATNEAISLAKGEFIGLFDHDDLLWPNALYEVVSALNRNKKLDFIYSDEDHIVGKNNEHLAPFFKPDWNPDFMHAVNYITHFAVIRTTLMKKMGGFKQEYNGAQDWDLFLRATDATKDIHHIPKVLYSWRIHSASTASDVGAKPYVVEAMRRAITDDLARKGHSDAKVEIDDRNPSYWKVTYPVKQDPLISIVIPTKDQYEIVKRCIDSIYQKTTYKNFEIVLVDTGSTDERVLGWYSDLKKSHKNIRVVNWHFKPFSYAKSCNFGASKAKGELLVMLNNDTEVMTPDWLEQMAGDAQRKEIGIVGCMLLYPDKLHIQHAGVGVGLGGVAANSFQLLTINQALTKTQHLMIYTKHDMTAVTAACFMVRKDLFDEIGGFDETYRVTYNDVDICLRVYDKGYQNLYTPHVRLLHHESISVGRLEEVGQRDTEEFTMAKEQFIRQWKQYIAHDPNLNPNLNKDNARYEVAVRS